MAKATIKDVAKLAGVGVGTVSRVLNNHPSVKPRTRESVREAIRAVQYEPESAARELSGLRGMSIGLNMAQGAKRLSPYFFLFFESLMGNVRAEGYRFEEIGNRPDGLPERLPDALVLFGAHDDDPRIDYLIRSSLPFVLLGKADGVFSVAPDDFSGGHQAGKHLARLGHREILYLGGQLAFQASLDRYRGFVSALSEAGLTHDPALVLEGGDSALEAYRVVRTFLEKGRRFTAVFASSDEMALGVQAAVVDGGFRVPEDISVVGYDDFPGLSSRLTTIHQDIPGMAATALELLKEGFRGQPPRQVLLPVQLVARETTMKRS